MFDDTFCHKLFRLACMAMACFSRNGCPHPKAQVWAAEWYRQYVVEGKVPGDE